MAEEDDAQKTEEPSARKLQRAREKGQTAMSTELKNWGILVTATLVLAIMAPKAANDLRLMLLKFIEQGETIAVDLEHLRIVFAELMFGFFAILMPLLLAVMIVAVLMSVAQSGLIWAPSKIAPEFSKISLLKGITRMFSSKSLVEFLKGMAKLFIVSVVSVGLVLPLFADITLLPTIDFIYTLERIHLIIIWLLAGSVIVMAVVAAFDYVYQKYTFMQQMRMTKHEVKDEHKQSEGDPHVKARIRQLRSERARQRMMAAVPDADVVVTNPTHFAVALNYKIEQMQAPILVAKGADHIAFKIREVAEEHDIPIVENAPLARALFAAVEIDEEIPMEHYQAVAEVIGYVMRLRGESIN